MNSQKEKMKGSMTWILRYCMRQFPEMQHLSNQPIIAVYEERGIK